MNTHTDVAIGPDERYVARFWSKVDRTSECWRWSAYVRPNGYGQFHVECKPVYAHRFAYELLVGPIAAGMHLDHLCRNKACVNPAHLEMVTPRVNILRGFGPSARAAAKTHCLNGHPFDETNTRITPSGKRQCRICARDYGRKFRARQPKRPRVPNNQNTHKTHCKRGHEFTPENTWRGGLCKSGARARVCKACVMASRERKANDQP